MTQPVTQPALDVLVDRIRQYELSCLPEDHPWRYHFTVLVSRQHDGTWIVTHDDMVLVDGDRWELKGCPPNVSREDWKASTSHVAATEQMVHAAMEGLPFPRPVSERTDT